MARRRGKPPTDFFKWLFVKRDIDGLVVGLMISTSISYLLRDITEGLVKPVLLDGLLGGDSTASVRLLGNDVELDWKKALGSLIALVLNLVLAFLVVRWSLATFPVNGERGKGNRRVAGAAAVNATR